jgi:hypothetical protein
VSDLIGKQPAYQVAELGGIGPVVRPQLDMLEIVGKSVTGRVATCRVERKRTTDHWHQLLRCSSARLGHVDVPATDGNAQELCFVGPDPSGGTGDELQDHQRACILIGAVVVPPGGQLLWCNVRHLAANEIGLGVMETAGCPRHPEINELHLPLIRDDQVRRADIPMHDPQRPAVFVGRAVSVAECAQQADPDEERQVGRQSFSQSC